MASSATMPVLLREVVEKRLAILEYLLRVHNGQANWLNTVHITGKDLDNVRASRNKDKVALHHFYLGGSLPNLTSRSSKSLAEYLRSMLVLFKEYETLRSAGAESMKSRLPSMGRRLLRLKSDVGEHEPMLRRRSSAGVGVPQKEAAQPEFQHLQIMPLPFIPDANQTFICLCETLVDAYKHVHGYLNDAASFNQENYDLLSKIDERINKQIIIPALKELESASHAVQYEETNKLNALFVAGRVMSEILYGGNVV